MTIKKTKSYDTIFLAMDKTEVNNHQNLMEDSQFEMDLMALYNKIKRKQP